MTDEPDRDLPAYRAHEELLNSPLIQNALMPSPDVIRSIFVRRMLSAPIAHRVHDSVTVNVGVDDGEGDDMHSSDNGASQQLVEAGRLTQEDVMRQIRDVMRSLGPPPFQRTGTVTGRMSSRDPEPASVPRSPGVLREISTVMIGLQRMGRALRAPGAEIMVIDAHPPSLYASLRYIAERALANQDEPTGLHGIFDPYDGPTDVAVITDDVVRAGQKRSAKKRTSAIDELNARNAQRSRAKGVEVIRRIRRTKPLKRKLDL